MKVDKDDEDAEDAPFEHDYVVVTSGISYHIYICKHLRSSLVDSDIDLVLVRVVHKNCYVLCAGFGLLSTGHQCPNCCGRRIRRPPAHITTVLI